MRSVRSGIEIRNNEITPFNTTLHSDFSFNIAHCSFICDEFLTKFNFSVICFNDEITMMLMLHARRRICRCLSTWPYSIHRKRLDANEPTPPFYNVPQPDERNRSRGVNDSAEQLSNSVNTSNRPMHRKSKHKFENKTQRISERKSHKHSIYPSRAEGSGKSAWGAQRNKYALSCSDDYKWDTLKQIRATKSPEELFEACEKAKGMTTINAVSALHRFAVFGRDR